jgi:hypothetical protein
MVDSVARNVVEKASRRIPFHRSRQREIIAGDHVSNSGSVECVLREE